MMEQASFVVVMVGGEGGEGREERGRHCWGLVQSSIVYSGK